MKNGSMELARVCMAESERYKGARFFETEMGDIAIDSGSMYIGGEELCSMDEYGWQLFAKLLDIPTPYMSRMGGDLRTANVMGWLRRFADKSVSGAVKDGYLIELNAGLEISKGDVLEILLREMPLGEVLSAFSQSNSTILDIANPVQIYEGEDGFFVPGVRVVLKSGLNAPEFSPILVEESTSAVIEFGEYFCKLNIKSLSYNDILNVIASRVRECVKCADDIFHIYRGAECGSIKDVRRRVSWLCRENGLPPRVESYAVGRIDELGLCDATNGDIIALFGLLGYINEVKQSSARKSQRIAGHIAMRYGAEHRCSKCDALEIGG